MNLKCFILVCFTALVCPSFANKDLRKVILLADDWQFINKDVKDAAKLICSTENWEAVSVPHDWAIAGPFDKDVDKQTGIITQNGENVPTEKTGRTGALPHVGVGWYRKIVTLSDLTCKQVLLTLDGAMNQPQIYINGTKVGQWANGYNYCYFDVTEFLVKGENLVAIRVENLPESSRWYPGAGLYRKVQLVVKDEVSFKHWGHFLTTPIVSLQAAKVNIKSKVKASNIRVEAIIKDAKGNQIACSSSDKIVGDEVEQILVVKNPQLWDTDHPHLYFAELKLYQNNILKDYETIRFGIRKIEYNPDKGGFILNNVPTKFKGVCLHHDLGPLGAAVNVAALKRQLTILKDMGCNAIRSSHNMPSLEQLELCDEMGFLFLAESFDEWKRPKMKNGYNLYFDEWAEKDIVNLTHATRNHPCIVMWSSGNEVPDQYGSEGVKRAKWLQDIFHREDPTRPVTVGMDQVKAVMKNGFGAIMDIPGLNYRVHLYEDAYEDFPQNFLLGSETASTVSSRGVYKFPAQKASMKTYADGQSSSYDLERCSWSNLPDDDFVLQDDKDWVIGEFVWTGFDYLGEPTPYDTYWPARSSYFGICDLAGLPKDRYYLYRSRWNTKEETLHVLPHWNWEGREGETTPVFVYTSYDSAELFINGKSHGIQRKTKDKTNQHRYRLMWMDVKYEPGILKVIAYDKAGHAAAEKIVRTAGAPHHIELSADRKTIQANGNDLSYVTATVVDKEGVLCPRASNKIKFKVTGKGSFRAACNGDATSLEVFHEPSMKVFSGMLVVLVQSDANEGEITLEVSGNGLKSSSIIIQSITSQNL